MVKFLHTADWQLGQTLKMVGPDRAEELREARLRSVRNLLALAREEDVDFILSAGDNFESNQVSNRLVRSAISTLNEFSTIPICIVPGNHDPLMEDYPFTRGVSDRLGDHVHILTEQEPVEIPGKDATIYPGICQEKKDSNSPIDWIPPREGEEGVRIGLAHGSWQVLPDLPRDDYPIDEDAAENLELDYLALGHWHSTFPDPEEDTSRTFYSGTPEPTSFEEGDSGNVLIVEIGSPREQPEVAREKVAEYSWIQKEANISDETSVDSLEEELLNLKGDPEKTLLSLEVEGTISLDVASRYEVLTAELEDQFYFLRDEGSELSFVPTDEETRQLVTGKGWLKGAVDKLKKLVSGDETYVSEEWSFDEPPTKEEAERALALIYAKLNEEEG